MATQRAVFLPEIVQSIVAETSEHGALFNFLTVNHVWHLEAARVLWRRTQLRHLWNLPLDRRQFYANWVMYITTFQEYSTIRRYPDTANKVWWIENRDRILNFPNLKNISLYVTDDDVPDEVIAQYLVPTLRVLYLSGQLTDGLISIITDRCRNLEVLVLLEFDDTNLQQLKKQRRQTHEHIFEKLTSFKCLDITPPVNEVLCNMPQLRTVTLVVPDIDPVLEYLATRHALLENAYVYSRTKNICLATLKSFVEQHRTLKELVLGFRGHEMSSNEELNDSWIQETTSVLPLLENFCVGFECDVSGEGLIQVGLNCPLLRALKVAITSENLVYLEDDALSQHENPVFKNLRWLDPTEIFEKISRSLLKKHLPHFVREELP